MFTAATRLLLENLSRWQLPIFRLAIPGTVLLRVFSSCQKFPQMRLLPGRRCLKDGKITIEETDAVAAGIAWEDAGQTPPLLKLRSMPNPFDRMAARMDAATIKKMGKTAIINGSSYDVVPAEQLEEMGPLSGTGTSLVVFTSHAETTVSTTTVRT
jgi:hypothetical protein